MSKRSKGVNNFKIGKSGGKDTIAIYLRKRGFSFEITCQNFNGVFDVVVVVPCYDELETLPVLLNSLSFNDAGLISKTAFLFVVNHPENAPADKKQKSTATLEYLKSVGEVGFEKSGVAKTKLPPAIKKPGAKKIIETSSGVAGTKFPLAIVELIEPGSEVPAANAGAGYPRKAGLDAALGLINRERPKNSLLVCLDADCEVAPEYLSVVHSLAKKGTQAAVLGYKHRADTTSNLKAIADYEVFLNSYTEGLKFAGSPYAYHTVGSTMVCSAEAYAKAGGMNTRRAGEDFYFLESLAKVTSVEVVPDILVFPSNRISERVIFGTGKAMMKHAETGEKIEPYPKFAFEKLKTFLEIYNRPYEPAVSSSEKFKAGKLNIPPVKRLFEPAISQSEKLESRELNIPPVKRLFEPAVSLSESKKPNLDSITLPNGEIERTRPGSDHVTSQDQVMRQLEYNSNPVTVSTEEIGRLNPGSDPVTSQDQVMRQLEYNSNPVTVSTEEIGRLNPGSDPVTALTEEIGRFDPKILQFLESHKFSVAMRKIYASSKDPLQIIRRKHEWFDALKTLKLITFLCNM